MANKEIASGKFYELFNPERYSVDVSVSDEKDITISCEDKDRADCLRTILSDSITCDDGELSITVSDGEAKSTDDTSDLFIYVCKAFEGVRSAKQISYSQDNDKIFLYLRILDHKDRYNSWFEDYDLDNYDKESAEVIQDGIFNSELPIYIRFVG